MPLRFCCLLRQFQKEINLSLDLDIPMDMSLCPVTTEWSCLFKIMVRVSAKKRNSENYQDRNNIHNVYVTWVQTSCCLLALQSHSGQNGFAPQKSHTRQRSHMSYCPGFARTESRTSHGLQAISNSESARTPDWIWLRDVSQATQYKAWSLLR